MARILAVFACVIVGLFSLSASAAPATAYDVEVLIFENKLPTMEGGELWTRDTPRPQKSDFADAITIGESFPAESGFSAAAAALERDGAYKVLLHRRWRQAAEEKSATKSVRLRNADGQIDGMLRFYTSRFLLVDLDLLMKDKTQESADLSYRMTEHRRVKPQEINYFDHPKLGVLVRVTAVGKE